MFDFPGKKLFVDEPCTAVVVEDFFRYELFVFLEIVDDMLEIFPPESNVGSLGILFYEVQHPKFEVVLVQTVPIEYNLIECRHKLDHVLGNFFRFCRD